MRNFHRWTIALSAAALVGLLGVGASSARAENNVRIQPAKSQPAKDNNGLRELRQQVSRVNTYRDGCR